MPVGKPFGDPTVLYPPQESRDFGPGGNAACHDLAAFERELRDVPAFEWRYRGTGQQQPIDGFGTAETEGERARVARSAARSVGGGDQSLALSGRQAQSRSDRLGKVWIGRKQSGPAA